LFIFKEKRISFIKILFLVKKGIKKGNCEKDDIFTDSASDLVCKTLFRQFDAVY